MNKARSFLVFYIWVLGNLIILSSCDIDLDTPPDNNPKEESPFESKEVNIFTWDKITPALYSAAANQVPDFFVENGGIFYAAQKNNSNIYSWRAKSSDNKVILGENISNFTINSVSINTNILFLDKFDKQIVAVTTNGAAFFAGQTKKATRVANILGGIAEVLNTANIGDSYFYIIGKQANIRKLVWLTVAGTSKEFYGFDGTKNITKFSSGSNNIPTNNNFSALAPYPNYNKIALAVPEKGLFTISLDYIGVSNISNPKIEQKDLNTPIDANHASQWAEVSGEAKIITDMKLVENKYLLIGFGKGSGGVVFADMSRDEIKFSPVEFKDAANEVVYKFVVFGKTAQIITDKGVMSFKEGVGTKEFLASELDQEPKLIRDFDNESSGNSGEPGGKEPLSIEDYRGGHVGDTPDTAIKFKSTAFFEGDWYYLTDKGIFRVQKEVKSRTFRK